jgi:hypothetical protein
MGHASAVQGTRSAPASRTASAAAGAVVTLELIGSLAMWAPIPAAWMWIGARVYDATGSFAADGAVVLAGFLATIALAMMALARLDLVWIALRPARRRADPGRDRLGDDRARRVPGLVLPALARLHPAVHALPLDAVSPRPPNHGRAAFARADVADSKRGYPEFELSAYAAARGLGFEAWATALPDGFGSVRPEWPDYQFNVMRGTLPSGDYGYLAHELYELAVLAGDLALQGMFWSTKYVNRSGLLGMDPRGKGEPFPDNAAWLPSTRIAIRLPEASQLPTVRVVPGMRVGAFGNPNLGKYGADGFRLVGETASKEWMERFFGGRVGPLLTSVDRPFVELRLDHSVVSLAVNGFVVDTAELDRLLATAGEIAQAARELASADHRPAPFGERLPPPVWADPGYVRQGPTGRWRLAWDDAFRRVAGELGMLLEDPETFHHAFPTQPVPGVARGVVRGVVPGTTTLGRLAWFAEGGRNHGALRGAVLLPAVAGAPATERGGTAIPETEMSAEVRDGVAAFWTWHRSEVPLDPGPLVARTMESARRLPIAELA